MNNHNITNGNDVITGGNDTPIGNDVITGGNDVITGGDDGSNNNIWIDLNEMVASLRSANYC